MSLMTAAPASAPMPPPILPRLPAPVIGTEVRVDPDASVVVVYTFDLGTSLRAMRAVGTQLLFKLELTAGERPWIIDLILPGSPETCPKCWARITLDHWKKLYLVDELFWAASLAEACART